MFFAFVFMKSHFAVSTFFRDENGFGDRFFNGEWRRESRSEGTAFTLNGTESVFCFDEENDHQSFSSALFAYTRKKHIKSF